MASLPFLVGLYVLFQAKHFFCDYPLQRPWMLAKGKRSGWFLPLLAHALVHATGTLMICIVVAPGFWWLALVDLVVHATVDRIKAHPDLGGQWSTERPYFWWAFGLDQAAHHLTHFGFIVVILTNL